MWLPLRSVVNGQKPGRLALVLSVSVLGFAVVYYGALFLISR